MGRRLRSIGRIAVGVIAGVLVANPVLLYFLQERLIFYPAPNNEGNLKQIHTRYHSVEEVVVRTRDGQSLHGWLQKTGQPGKAPTLVYFGGNAEDVSFLPALRDRVEGWSLLAMNYRGYGASSGAPGEKELFADALAVFDYAAARGDVDPQRIAALGRSLGSGVAAYLAAHRPLDAVVLVTPYDSIASIAADKFWFAPTSLILKHRFDSVHWAASARQPALFLVAEKDETVSLAHSRRLFDAWPAGKSWHLVPEENHDTIEFYPRYWETIASFLNRAARPR